MEGTELLVLSRHIPDWKRLSTRLLRKRNIPTFSVRSAPSSRSPRNAGRASSFARAIPRRKSVFFGNIGERIRAFTPVPFHRMGVACRACGTGLGYPYRSIACSGFVRRVCRNRRGEGTAYRGRNAARCGGSFFARRHEASPFGGVAYGVANLLEKQAPAALYHPFGKRKRRRDEAPRPCGCAGIGLCSRSCGGL